MTGNTITAQASVAPAVVNTRRMPNQSYSSAPTGPRTPNSTSSSQPVTTGGSTSGRCTNGIQHRPAGKPAARQHPGGQDRQRQGEADRARGDRQRQPDGLPFLRR